MSDERERLKNATVALLDAIANSISSSTSAARPNATC